MRRSSLPVCLMIALAAPAAGWPRPTGGTPGDPWEHFNRRVFALNQVVDRTLVRPLSKLTSGLTPGPIGKAIHNFLVNLNEPVVIVNDLLQARPIAAFRSAFRLVINTTAGGLGAVDVAKALGDPAHVNGFGDTLGRWGVHSGPYLMLPVFGPSSVRDAVGSAADDVTLPIRIIDYPYRTEVDVAVAVVGGLKERQDVARDLDTLLGGAADPYATLRSTYLQAREAQIKGEKALPVLPDIDDTPPSPANEPAPGAPGLQDNAAPTARAPDATSPPEAVPPPPPGGTDQPMADPTPSPAPSPP